MQGKQRIAVRGLDGNTRAIFPTPEGQEVKTFVKSAPIYARTQYRLHCPICGHELWDGNRIENLHLRCLNCFVDIKVDYDAGVTFVGSESKEVIHESKITKESPEWEKSYKKA